MLGIFPKDKNEKGGLAHGRALGPQLMNRNNECDFLCAVCAEGSWNTHTKHKKPKDTIGTARHNDVCQPM